MYGHSTTERKEENEKGMRAKRDGHRWPLYDRKKGRE